MEHRTATTPSAIKAADHDSINSSASPAPISSESVPLTDPLLKTTHPRVFFFLLVALLVLNQSFSAVYTVLSKRAYNTGLSPVILCFYRDATVAAILCICTRVIDGPLAVDWKHVPRLFFCGFTGVFSSQFFYTYGIKLTSSNNGAIMQLLTPVLTTGLSIALGLERLDIARCHGVTRLLGLASALGGAAFMLAGGFSASPTQTASDLLIGNILFIVNTSAVAMFLIAQKPLLQIIPSLRVTFWCYVFGALSMGTASLYYVDDAAVWIIKSAVSLELLGYSIVFGSFAIYVIIAFTNRHGSPVLITFFIPLQVLFVAVLAYFFLDETFAARDAIGAALIIFGLFCVLWAQYESSRLKTLEEAQTPGAQAGGDSSDATLDHSSALSVASPQRAHRNRQADAHAPLLDHAARV